jgi:spore coat protein U-like protein
MWDTDLSIIWETFEMKKILAAAVALTMAGLSQGVTTLTASLDVSVNVVTSCTFSATNYSLTFADFNPTGPAINGTGTIGVTCNATVPYTITLGDGLNAQTGVRRMNDGGANRLEYTLSRPDATNTTNTNTPWNTTSVVARTGTGALQPATVYGQITAGGNNGTVPAGAYSDTVVVSLIF